MALSCKPTSHSTSGLASAMAMQAAARLTSAVLRRRSAVAVTNSPPITAARTTVASPPTSSAYPAIAASAGHAARRLPTSRAAHGANHPRNQCHVRPRNDDHVAGSCGIKLAIKLVGNIRLDAQQHPVGQRRIRLGQAAVDKCLAACPQAVDPAQQRIAILSRIPHLDRRAVHHAAHPLDGQVVLVRKTVKDCRLHQAPRNGDMLSILQGARTGSRNSHRSLHRHRCRRRPVGNRLRRHIQRLLAIHHQRIGIHAARHRDLPRPRSNAAAAGRL